MQFPTNIVLLALSFVGFGSMAYLLYYKDNDQEDLFEYKGSKKVEIKVNVPKDCIAMVIGRKGTTIRSIEDASGAKVKIVDSNGENKTCIIRGTKESVDHAEFLIHEIIANQPLIETFIMQIPNLACGRIIGRNGDTIRHICLNSNAKITVERESVDPHQRTVVINGTSEQIAAARILLTEKVEEDREYRNKIEQSVNKRSPRHQPKYLLAGSENGSQTTESAHERLVPTSNDGLLEVYVSAIYDPENIWLQVKGPCTVELDRLNDKMTEYYNKSEMRAIHALSEARVGLLVAAPFQFDSKYYRAEVTSVQENNDDPELGLYYVDYGDSGECRLSRAFDLRTDFLKLRFQAIESILAKVKPREDRWTEEAIMFLEEISYVALWKPLTAQIHSYVERPTRAKREGSPVPCVNLYDTNGQREVDIAKELVDKGFAAWIEEGDEEAKEKQIQSNGCEENQKENILEMSQ